MLKREFVQSLQMCCAHFLAAKIYVYDRDVKISCFFTFFFCFYLWFSVSTLIRILQDFRSQWLKGLQGSYLRLRSSVAIF